jgi:hypothetical protein
LVKGFIRVSSDNGPIALVAIAIDKPIKVAATFE